MEIHQLQYFITVAELGHFTRAAHSLHVAQPSVSQQVRKLELELGSKLFHRTKRGISLTDAGRTLLPWARRILNDLAAARSEVQELASLQRGHVSIGATPSLATHFLPEVLAQFHSLYPGITFSFREGGSQPLLTWLLDGALDLALVIGPMRHAALVMEPLFEEPILIGVSLSHPLAHRSEVTIQELRDEPFVLFRDGYDLRELTLRACHDAGFDPIVTLDGGEMDSVLRFVSAGLGIALLPAAVLGPGSGTVGVPLVQPSPRRGVGLASRRDHSLSAGARAFSDAVRTHASRSPSSFTGC